MIRTACDRRTAPIVHREADTITMMPCCGRCILSESVCREMPLILACGVETTMIKRNCAIVVAVFCLIAPALADEETPDNEHGRYSFSKIAEGLLRLDMQTGQVSVCSQ